MPRLPTREEARAIEEHRLADVWRDIGTAEDPMTFFADLAAITKAELLLHPRIRIAEAMLGYATEIRFLVDAKDVVKARRLAKGLRREAIHLQRILANFERQRANASEAVRLKHRLHAARECGAIYENARQNHKQFEGLTNAATGMPDKRFAEIGDAMWQAMCKVAPPFRFADCRGAVVELDTVLERWTDATGIQKGRAPQSKALTDLIAHLMATFKDATGRSASASKSGFRSFIGRVLAALPPDIYNADAMTSSALPKRIRRITRNS